MIMFMTFLLSFVFAISLASPTISSPLQPRTNPFFPDTPPSCPICRQNYDSTNSCAEAAPVLANFTNVIFNPGAFIDVIKCACVDTFQSAYPQCVDCFIRTNQSQVLGYDTGNLPDIVKGMRNVCAIQSALLGNVSQVNGETTPSANPPAPSPTSAASNNVVWGGAVVTMLLLAISIGMIDLYNL